MYLEYHTISNLDSFGKNFNYVFILNTMVATSITKAPTTLVVEEVFWHTIEPLIDSTMSPKVKTMEG